MKILTWPTSNFGDRLNELVWPAYIGDKLDTDPDSLLVGIGSLLNHRLPTAQKKCILGSGVGHGHVPVPDSTWRVVWVRGPRSAAVLGLTEQAFITDGAVLLADMFGEPAPKVYETSFIPHCSAVEEGVVDQLSEVCANLGVHLINPHQPPLDVLAQIKKSGRVITEALHGAIVADAFRVPWVPVTRDGVLQFKWEDWSESMEMTYRPVSLPYHPRWWSDKPHPRLSRRVLFPLLKPTSKLLLERCLSGVIRGRTWRLSREGLVRSKVTRIKEVLTAAGLVTSMLSGDTKLAP